MTEEELKAMINDDDIINMDDESIELALEEAVDAADITEQNSLELPPANDNNKMVNQLDDVTKESEEKATEIFDIIEGISSELMDKEEHINENIDITNSNIELFKTLSAKFPDVEAFKIQLEKNEKSLENINVILKMLQDSGDSIMNVMSIMQYQDIHRQKIERVIYVMRSLSNYMNSLFESKIDDSQRVASAKHLPGDFKDNLTSEEDIEKLLAKFSK
jgi:hypothetical protein